MPGTPTFLIGDYKILSDTPETWSFSALNGFEDCPKRWALSRIEIPCFSGPIPQKPNKNSLEGTLLHELIERFEQHSKNPGVAVFRPRKNLLELVALWAKNNERNPRIDSKTLVGQVRLEEILRAFHEACVYVRCEPRPSNSEASPNGFPGKVFNGSESWLRDPRSKLRGRADFISAGEILDFKSGDQHDQHVDQIVFYGALYLALTGQVPNRLRLVYTSTNQVNEVPVPAKRDLEATLDTMRHRAIAYDQQIASGDFLAKPAPLKCSFCNVRGLCNDHWASGQGAVRDGSPRQTLVIDYTPTATAQIESAALGVYVRDNLFGVPSLLHLPQKVADAMGGQATRVRILSLRANCASDSISLAFTANSEIYVKTW
jgi:PD-(D/E)XK nuclease superfamily